MRKDGYWAGKDKGLPMPEAVPLHRGSLDDWRRWSLAEDKLLIKLRTAGIEIPLICEAMNRPPNSVSHRLTRLRKFGVLGRHGRLWWLEENGMEKLEARHAEITAPQRRDDTVADLFMEGLTVEQIAERIGRCRTTVYNHLTKLREEGEIGYAARPWTEEEIELALEMRAAGHSFVKVGQALKRRPNNVFEKLSKLRRGGIERAAIPECREGYLLGHRR